MVCRMASKRSKTAATDDELGELFGGLGDDAAVPKNTKAKPAASKSKKDAAEADILAELENQLEEKQPDRPHTPRVREPAAKATPAKRTSTNTPPPAADRTSEDKQSGTGAAAAARKSGDSSRSYHASFTPSATSSELQESEKKGPVEEAESASAGGGWWGWFPFHRYARHATGRGGREGNQQNEEAKKWADQVRGNVGALRGLSKSLRVLSIPSQIPSVSLAIATANTHLTQATTSASKHFPPSPTSSTPWPRPFPRTSVS